MTKYLCFVSFATMILFAGCKKEEITSYSPVINNVTDNIIVATYTDLDAKAQLLVDAANALKADRAIILDRIESTAANRDIGTPNTISNTRNSAGDPNFPNWGNGGNGWGGGGGWGS